MKHVSVNTLGVCCKAIAFDTDGETVRNIQFTGGCPGNLSALANLMEGASAQDIINRFTNHPCGTRPTSCMALFANAVKNAVQG
jgi:uncharacterized protein (TIGR03905 family)